MHYALATWEVRDLLLIPSFMFSESAVIQRLVAPKRSGGGKPLAATARRAGWVGCNIVLHRIAPEARITIVTTIASPRRRTGVAPVSDFRIFALNAGFPRPHQQHRTGIEAIEDGDRRDACPTQTIIVPPGEVRAQFKRVKPLKDISVKQRGWTLDVLNIVRRLVESRRRGH